MKTVILSLICFLSFSLHAACKCNCDPADFTICANQNDLDRPCPNLCGASTGASGLAPMITACPIGKITMPNTGVTRTVNMCTE